MDKQTLYTLNTRLTQIEEDKKNIEQRIKDNQEILKKIQDNFETDLEKLRELQDIENSLRINIYEKQKESLHETLSLESMKKMFGGAAPLFSRLKTKTLNKAKEIKNYVDGTSLNKQWVEDCYEEYKALCIKKGEEIQSKEEFKKIALSVKNMQGEVKDLSLQQIIQKVAVEAGHAKKSIKSIMSSLKIEEKFESLLTSREKNNVTTEKKLSTEKSSDYKAQVLMDKKTVLANWIESKNPDLKLDSNTLYTSYLKYINDTYSENKENITYSNKSGIFSQAIKRYLNSKA